MHDRLFSLILEVAGFTVWHSKEKKRFQLLHDNSYSGLIYPNSTTIHLVKNPHTDNLKKTLESYPEIKNNFIFTYEPPTEPV